MSKVKQIDDFFPIISTKIDVTKIVNEDDMISDSQFLIPTQHSIKQYVLSKVLNSGNPYIDALEIVEEFIPSVYINPNTNYTITLDHNTKENFAIDIAINGIDLNSTYDYIHIIGTNTITINVEYPLDNLDTIKVTYKTSV